MSFNPSHRLATFTSFVALMTSMKWAEVGARDVQLGIDEIWTNFKQTHAKMYADIREETYRRSVWQDNVDYIQKHNLEADLGLHSYTLGLNRFADLTQDEFRKLMLGTRVEAAFNASHLSADKFDSMTIPDTVDWRTQGYVTAIKDQGNCGSCWAFSTTGTLEGQYFKKNGKLVQLSEQNLVDCSSPQGNNGCGGGLPQKALEYVIANGGINTEAAYPYEGDVGRCRFDPSPSSVGLTCTWYQMPTPRNETALMQAAAAVGPISVAIDAGRPTFQLYKTGVYDDPSCSSTQLNHAVLLIGYGNYNGKPYWRVKNSWGAMWGMNGFVLMSRNKNNQCGIASVTVYPTC